MRRLLRVYGLYYDIKQILCRQWLDFRCSNESYLVLVGLVEGSLTSKETENRGVQFYPFLRSLNPYPMSVLGLIDSTTVLAALVAYDMDKAEPCMAHVPKQKISPSQRMLRSILIGLRGAIGVRLMYGALLMLLILCWIRRSVRGEVDVWDIAAAYNFPLVPTTPSY